MRAILFFLLFLIICNFSSKSQIDTSKYTVSINLLNNLFNQHTIEIDYKLNQKHAVGFGGGFVLSNPWWNKDHRLYNGTDNSNPFGYYNGWVLIMNYKRLNISRNHWFFQSSFFYKHLYYDNVHFENSNGDSNPSYEWTRSEICNVYGIKLLVGKRIRLGDGMALEPVFGCSVRLKSREYTTFSMRNLPDGHLGEKKGSAIFPGIQAGLLLTLGSFH